MCTPRPRIDVRTCATYCAPVPCAHEAGPIERGELRLHAERRRRAPDGAQYLVRERADLTVSRRLMPGDTLDVEHVDAEHRDGVLTLHIPLRGSAKLRQVAVRDGADADDRAAITVDTGS